jgi:hypothetical protein
VGHSGGAAMSVMTMERMTGTESITSAVLLQPALSQSYDLSAALSRTESAIWSFYSLFDVFFLCLGTLAFGTMDGPHRPASGMVGFRRPEGLSAAGQELYSTRLREIQFHPSMMADFHFGGHMGSTSRPFVANHVAPCLQSQTTQLTEGQ